MNDWVHIAVDFVLVVAAHLKLVVAAVVAMVEPVLARSMLLLVEALRLFEGETRPVVVAAVAVAAAVA